MTDAKPAQLHSTPYLARAGLSQSVALFQLRIRINIPSFPLPPSPFPPFPFLSTSPSLPHREAALLKLARGPGGRDVHEAFLVETEARPRR